MQASAHNNIMVRDDRPLRVRIQRKICLGSDWWINYLISSLRERWGCLSHCDSGAFSVYIVKRHWCDISIMRTKIWETGLQDLWTLNWGRLQHDFDKIWRSLVWAFLYQLQLLFEPLFSFPCMWWPSAPLGDLIFLPIGREGKLDIAMDHCKSTFMIQFLH
jgi:hypothetical protein